MTRRKKIGRVPAAAFLAVALASLHAPAAWSGETAARSRGQTLYVPAYSHVFHGDRSHPFLLTVTLVIRNADPENAITLEGADYHGSRGERILAYVKEPVSVSPLCSVEYVVQESDKRGGVGASFLVRWSAGKPVVPPVVEAVMIGTAAAQGISFVSGARVIRDAPD